MMNFEFNFKKQDCVEKKENGVVFNSKKESTKSYLDLQV